MGNGEWVWLWGEIMSREAPGCWSEMLEREDKEVRQWASRWKKAWAGEWLISSGEPASILQWNKPLSCSLSDRVCVVPVFHQHADNLQNWTQHRVLMPAWKEEAEQSGQEKRSWAVRKVKTVKCPTSEDEMVNVWKSVSTQKWERLQEMDKKKNQGEKTEKKPAPQITVKEKQFHRTVKESHWASENYSGRCKHKHTHTNTHISLQYNIIHSARK